MKTEPQYLDTEIYIQLVRNIGIEGAYRERFRRTGRTVRDVLELTKALSEGRKIWLIINSNIGWNHKRSRDIIRQVRDTAESFRMNVTGSKDIVEYGPSGGFVALILDGVSLPSNAEVYKLHDL